MTDSPLYRMRKARRMTQQDVADAWLATFHEVKPAKAFSYYEAWPGPTGRQPSLTVLRNLARIYSCRVSDLIDDDPALPAVAPATVAVAIVPRGHDVLLVRRRNDPDLEFAFPSGYVKDGQDPMQVAVRECAAETGVQAFAVRELGARSHPIKPVVTRYVWCEYLAGEPHNGDPEELTAALWAPIHRLTAFTGEGRVFQPVLDALGGARV